MTDLFDLSVKSPWCSAVRGCSAAAMAEALAAAGAAVVVAADAERGRSG